LYTYYLYFSIVINNQAMKRIFATLREKIIAPPTFDFGVLILFSLVSIMFVISFVKVFL
jgi:hypothetical protein